MEIDNNTNQQMSSTQIPSNQQPSAPSNPRSSKKTLLIILGVFVLLITVGVGGYFIFQSNNASKTNPSSNVKSENNPTVNQPKSQVTSFQTLSLSITNLNDPETELYFADANKVYKVSLDGSSPQEIASFPHKVGSVNALKNGDILISTGNSKYEKVVNKGPQDADYKEISSEYHYYIIKNDTKEEIDDKKYRVLLDLESGTGEKIYTKQLANGQAEILVDKLDGTPPTKIGLLKEKLLTTQVCEIGNNCLEKQHPDQFIASFDGKYLLNKPPGGGGLGVPGIVVSRDGSKAYKIDFYWYVSSAMWIGNNKLLTKAQDGKQKIFTFNEDGTFNESSLAQDLGGYFSQNGLSPTKEFLLVNSDNPVGISLFNLNKQTHITVEKKDKDKLIKQYNFQDEIQIDPRINHLFGFLGWNRKGDKFAYSEQISPFANTEIDNPTEIREIKIYDVPSGKISSLIKLNPHPKNADEYLLQGKPVSDVGKFTIR